MRFPHRSSTVAGTLALAATLTATLAGCSGSSDGVTDPSPISTTPTVVTSPPTATGAPVTGTPTVGAPTTGPVTAGAPSGGAAATGSAGDASGPGLCTPTVATFAVTPGEGAAGSSYFEVIVTNASQRSCVTTGFPGIALLDASNQQILQAARETGGAASATITLAPGETASARVRAADMSTGNGADCPVSEAFLLTLPDNTDSTRIVHETPACSVVVSAFVRGDGS